MNHVGLITRCNKIVTRIKQNSAQKTRVFDVPVRDKDKDKEEEDNCPLPCPLLARARRPSPVVSSVNFKAHGVEDKNSKQINVTVGELAKRPSVFLTIETLNTKNPKGLGHLELVQEGKDMAAMIEANRQNLHKLWSKLDPCDQEVACVRGVALLLHGERSWEAGDWAAYHLLPLRTLYDHAAEVLPLLLQLLCWLPMNGDAVASSVQLSHAVIAYEPPNLNKAWAGFNQQNEMACYGEPRLVPQEEDSLGVMLCLEDCEDYKLQPSHQLFDVAVRDPADPTRLRQVSLLDIMTLPGHGGLLWRLQNLQQETFLFNLDAYVQRNGQENALQGGSQQGARGSREAQAQQGEEVELWASAAEGAPFLVVQAEGEDGEGELRVVEELGEEQLGNLLQAEVKEKMTLGPSAMKSLIGRYWAYVVYSRWALGKGEELLGQLGARLQLHAAAAGAGVPGGEEAVEEEGAPDHVAAAGVGVPLAEEAVEVEGALGPAAAAVLQPELLGQRQPQGTADSRNATRDELLRAAPAVQLRESGNPKRARVGPAAAGASMPPSGTTLIQNAVGPEDSVDDTRAPKRPCPAGPGGQPTAALAAAEALVAMVTMGAAGTSVGPGAGGGQVPVPGQQVPEGLGAGAAAAAGGRQAGLQLGANPLGAAYQQPVVGLPGSRGKGSMGTRLAATSLGGHAAGPAAQPPHPIGPPPGGATSAPAATAAQAKQRSGRSGAAGRGGSPGGQQQGTAAEQAGWASCGAQAGRAEAPAAAHAAAAAAAAAATVVDEDDEEWKKAQQDWQDAAERMGSLVRARARANREALAAAARDAEHAKVVEGLQVQLRERSEQAEELKKKLAEAEAREKQLATKLAEAEAGKEQAVQLAREEWWQRVQQVFNVGGNSGAKAGTGGQGA